MRKLLAREAFMWVFPPSTHVHLNKLSQGYYFNPCPAVFLRLSTSQAHPLLHFLPRHIPAEFHCDLAIDITHIVQLHSILHSGHLGPFRVVLLLRACHTRSETKGTSPVWKSADSACAGLRGHSNVLRSVRLARTPLPLSQLECK